MATESQIEANRENAKSTQFGLFTTANCVLPHEKEDYEFFCRSLWEELMPVGAVEEVTAAEFVRAAWRLRRCANAEATLGQMAVGPADPILDDDHASRQIAIDRARAQAQNGMRRAKSDLEKLQAARLSHRPEPKPAAAAKQNEAKIVTRPAPSLVTDAIGRARSTQFQPAPAVNQVPRLRILPGLKPAPLREAYSG